MLKFKSSLERSLGTVLVLAMLFCIHNVAYAQKPDMIIRISEIEVHSQHLEEYNAILKYEAEASVRLEKGVIAIFRTLSYIKEQRF